MEKNVCQRSGEKNLGGIEVRKELLGGDWIKTQRLLKRKKVMKNFFNNRLHLFVLVTYSRSGGFFFVCCKNIFPRSGFEPASSVSRAMTTDNDFTLLLQHRGQVAMSRGKLREHLQSFEIEECGVFNEALFSFDIGQVVE